MSAPTKLTEFGPLFNLFQSYATSPFSPIAGIITPAENMYYFQVLLVIIRVVNTKVVRTLKVLYYGILSLRM